MNTYLSFEIAKLLKEKYIFIETDEIIFYRDNINNIEEHQIKNKNFLHTYTGFNNKYSLDENEYQTYSIVDIIMWLYEKYNIWIEIHIKETEIEGWKNCFQVFINGEALSFQVYKTPTEAYEAGIEYILINLI